VSPRESPGGVPGPRGPGRALRTPGGNRGAGGPPPGPGNPEIPLFPGFCPKYPIFGVFGPFPGIPGKTPFSGSRGATGGSPRGVDVKPPSRGGPGFGKRAYFGQNGQKWAFWAILPKFGQKRRFGAFLGPWGLPGTPPGRGFYINPSRRGPAVAADPSSRGPGPGGLGEPQRGVGGPLPRSGA